MPNRIKILPEEIINKIAAGEVIERPASVVKELIENSIDAEANKINVEIAKGGKRLIRIEDNGYGMSKDDVLNAFERHATSKLDPKGTNLYNISTLGFRGEALSSIASVSQLELISKEEDDIAATLIKIYAGVIKEVSEIGHPRGTSISIKNLFFNLPARKKFLKTENTEFHHILNLINTYALQYPNIAFQLKHNNRTHLHLAKVENIRSRVLELWGKEIYKDLLDIDYEVESIKISGLVGKPKIYRKARSHYLLFINGRPISDRFIYAAVQKVFEGRIPQGKYYPILLLNMLIDPTMVDVNVHPTKREVRFADSYMIRENVIRALEIALSSYQAPIEIIGHKVAETPITPLDTFPSEAEITISTENESSLDVLTIENQSEKEIISTIEITEEKGMNKSISEISPIKEIQKSESSENNEISIFPLNKTLQLKKIWQSKNTYILLTVEDGIMIIDQHAAHERILYERTLKAIREKPYPAQTLLFSQTLDLSIRESEIIKNYIMELEQLGFAIKLFSERTLVIDAHPTFLMEKWDDGMLIREIIDNLMELEGDKPNYDNKIHHIAASIACKAAIKAGQSLNQEEMSRLLEDLWKCDSPYTCPHGRPITITLTWNELERKFKRSGF